MTQESHGKTIGKNTRWSGLMIVRAGFLLLICGIVAGSCWPQERLWGLHFLAYYSLVQQLTFWLLAACALGLALWRPAWLAERRDIPADSPWKDFLWVAGSGWVFWVWSAAAPLLGDGQLWLTGIGAHVVTYTTSREPLTLFIYHRLFAVLNPLGIQAASLVKWLSIVAGIVSVTAWLTLARHLKVNRLTALLLCGTWSGVELFFGYAETYSLMTASATWMVVLMIISPRTGKPSRLVYPLAAVSIALSYIAVTYLPAVIAYGWWARKKTLKIRKTAIIVAGSFIAAAALYFGAGWHHGNLILMPLFSFWSENGYAVFTWAHGIDLVNDLFFTAGPFFVLALAFGLRGRKKLNMSDASMAILSLLVIYPMAARIMHSSGLGMPRDWDIGAAFLVAAPPLALVLWKEWALSKSAAAQVRALLAAWMLIAIVPWIGVQSSESRSLKRIYDLLRLDPPYRECGWVMLASYYYQHGHFEDWGRCTREAARLKNNPRLHANLAFYYANNRNFEQARIHAAFARQLIEADSVITDWEDYVTDPNALLELGKDNLAKLRLGDAGKVFAIAEMLSPKSLRPKLALLDLLLTNWEFAESNALFVKMGADSASLDSMQEHLDEWTQKPNRYDQMFGYAGLSLLAHVRNDSLKAETCAEQAGFLAKYDPRLETLKDIIGSSEPPGKGQ